jgi:uncharacterized membrane protein
MSHVRVKTKYNVEAAYGSTEEQTLYVHHNNSSDYVTVYDNEGKELFSFDDTMRNNLLDAIVRAAGPVNHGELPEGVEYMNEQDWEFISKRS